MATEEILLKYKADITDLQSKVVAIEAQVRKTEKSFVDFDKAKSKAFTINSEAATAKLKQMGAAVVAAFSIGAVVNFARQSVEAFKQAELSARQLQAAVSAQGGLQADYDKLLAQSKELQKTTIFNDEAIQDAQRMAIQFGLTTDTVEDLIPLITDFAAATGQDLNSAMSSVLRGIDGSAKALKVYGVQIDTTATRNENLSRITEQLSNKFQGQAEILAKTSVGNVQRLANAYDELKESVGAFLIPAVEGFVKLAKAAVDFTKVPISDELEKEQQAFKILELRLHDVNLPQADRIKLIKELQSKYPDYLGNINAETVSNEDLYKALRTVNEQLVNKIILQRQDEKIAKQNEETASQRIDVLEAEDAMLAAIAEARDKYNFVLKDGLTTEQQSQAAAKFLLETQGRVGTSYNKARATLTDLAQAQQSYTAAVSNLNIENNKSNKLTQEKEELLKRLNIIQAKSTDGAPTGLEGETDEERRKREENEKKAAEAAKKALEEKQKEIDAFNLARAAAQKKADEELLQLTIAAIKNDFEKQREQSELDFSKFEKDKQAQFEQGLITQESRNELVKAAFRKLQDELAEINKEEATSGRDESLKLRLAEIDKFQTEEITKLQESFIKKGDFSEKATEQLQDAITEQELVGLQERLIALRNSGQDITDISAQIAAAQIDINKKKNDDIVKADEEAAAKRIALINKIQENFELSAQAIQAASGLLFGGQIANLEAQEEANQEHFDREQEQIDEQVDKRLITEAQGERKSADLKKQRAESEKKSNEEVKKLKRQQAEIDKALAIFRIGLQLAEAIAELNPFKIAAATVQLGVVIATPIPKFKAGAKWVERGRNAQGEDTIPAMLDEGERVVSRTKNIKHWDIYEAIDEGRLNQYVMKNFVAPALKDQQRKFEDNKQKTFADNISNALVYNGLTYNEADRIRRKGTRITNEESLAKTIASEVAKAITRQIAFDK